MSLDIDQSTDGVFTADRHLVQSISDFHAPKQDGNRTAIVAADGAFAADSEGNELIDKTAAILRESIVEVQGAL